MNDKQQNLIEHLNHMFAILQGAHLSYEIWWTFRNSNDRTKYVDILNHYYFFFKPSIHAHFLAALMGISKLFDKRRDTMNLNNLTKNIKQSRIVTDDELLNLQQDLKELEPLVEKVGEMRNKVFAHISKTDSYEEVFDEVKITPNNLKELLDKTMDFLNRVALFTGIDEHGFLTEGRSATLKVLEVLKNEWKQR